MKKLYSFMLAGSALLMAAAAQAQSFVPQADTVWGVGNTSGLTNLSDTIAVPATVTLMWRVQATDFPADWLPEPTLGICDASLCRQNTGGQLWNGTAGTAFNCVYPGLGNSHDFHLQINLVGASGGTHYLTVRVDDQGSGLSKKMTFVIDNGTTSVAAVNAGITGIGLLPNPAQNSTRLAFTLADASQVQCKVYDMAGRNVFSIPAARMSAGKQVVNISTADLAAGIYNVALITGKGTVTEHLTVVK